jgi:chromate transporter
VCIHRPFAFAGVNAAFLLLAVWKTPPWAVVVLCAVAGGLIG